MGQKFQEAAAKLLVLMRQAWLKKHGVPLPSPTLTAQQHAEIEECFEMLDQDGSGAIDVREIVHAFGALGFTISKDAIEELMMEADPDGSGELEFDEFLSLMGRALYHPDEHGKALVAKTGSGDLSFHDMVRAFRRKKLIESLMRGGDARLKVVEFHEKVQGLIRAETEELRQRQNTHAIFEKMETAKAEREKLNKHNAPTSQRSQKVKARLQEAIGRSLNAFESLYRRHQSHTELEGGADGGGPSSSTAGHSEDLTMRSRLNTEDTDLGSAGSGPSRASSPLGRGHRRSVGGASVGGGLTFLTEAAVEVASPGSPPNAGLLRALDTMAPRPRREVRVGPTAVDPLATARSHEELPPSRCTSVSSFDGMSAQVTKRVSVAVLKYFQNLEELVKKQEQKYDEAARLNASFIPPPPDRSEFKQLLQPSRPTSRLAMSFSGSSTTLAATSSTRSSPRSARGRISTAVPAAGVPSPRMGSGRGSRSGSSSAGAATAAAPPRLQRPTSPDATAASSVGRRQTYGDRYRRSRTTGGIPVTVAWTNFVAAAGAAGGGSGSGGGLTTSPSAATLSSSASPLLPTAPSGVAPSRAWRQAPGFGPGAAATAPAFGWGSGVPPGAKLRASGTQSPAPGPMVRSPGPAGQNGSMGQLWNEAVGVHPQAGSLGEVWASWSGVPQVGRPAGDGGRTLDSGRGDGAASALAGAVSTSSDISIAGGVGSSGVGTCGGGGGGSSSGAGSSGAGSSGAGTMTLPSVTRAASTTFGSPDCKLQPGVSELPRSSVAVTQHPAGACLDRAGSGAAAAGPAAIAAAAGGSTGAMPPPPSAFAQPAPAPPPVLIQAQAHAPIPGPITRTWAAQSRILTERLSGSTAQPQPPALAPQSSLAHAASLPATSSTALTAAASTLYVQRVREGGGRAEGGRTSTPGTLPSSGAGNPTVQRTLAATAGRRGHSFGHGPLRQASRGHIVMGNASGAAAAAMIDGIVSVGPAPAQSYVCSSGVVAAGTAAGGGGGDGRLTYKPRYGRFGPRPGGEAPGGVCAAGGHDDSGSGDSNAGGAGGGGGGGARGSSGRRLGSSGSSGSSGSGSGGGPGDRRTTDGCGGASGPAAIRGTAASASAEAPAAAVAAAAAGPAERQGTTKQGSTVADMAAILEDAAATNEEARSMACGSPPEPPPAAASFPPPPAAREPPPSAAVSAAAVQPHSSNGHDALSRTTSISSAPPSPRTSVSLPPLRTSGSSKDSHSGQPPSSVQAGSPAPPVRAPQPPPQPPPQPQPSALPGIPSQAGAFPSAAAAAASAPDVQGAVVSPAAVAAATPTATAAPAAAASQFSVSMPSVFATVGPTVVAARPASPSASATNTAPAVRSRLGTPATYNPRGAYISLQLSQRSAAAAGGSATGGGGLAAGAGAAVRPPQPARKTVLVPDSTRRQDGAATPLLHDRVVVTFFGQQLHRASNGAVVLPAGGPTAPTPPPSPAMAARSSLSAAAASLPGTSPTASPIATTAATAAAWLSHSGGPSHGADIGPGSPRPGPHASPETQPNATADAVAATGTLAAGRATPAAPAGPSAFTADPRAASPMDFDRFLGLGPEPSFASSRATPDPGPQHRLANPSPPPPPPSAGSLYLPYDTGDTGDAGGGRLPSRKPAAMPPPERFTASALGPWDAPSLGPGSDSRPSIALRASTGI